MEVPLCLFDYGRVWRCINMAILSALAKRSVKPWDRIGINNKADFGDIFYQFQFCSYDLKNEIKNLVSEKISESFIDIQNNLSYKLNRLLIVKNVG